MRRFLVVLIAMLLGSVVSDASTITYQVNRKVGAGSVTGTIQTDGTLGTLATGDITDWNLLISDGGTNTYDLTGPLSGNNSAVAISAANVTATAANLFFDFSGSDGSFLFQTGIYAGSFYYCDQAGPFSSTILTPCLSGESIAPTSFNGPGYIDVPQSGNQIIGTAVGNTVPEPSTYALLLIGLVLLGSFRSSLKKI